MRRSFCLALISILIIIAVGWAVPAHAHHLQRAATASLPVTSSSPEAGALYQKGITELENLYVERAVGEWRAAVKADPNFGLAWAWIAFESGSPEEAATT